MANYPYLYNLIAESFSGEETIDLCHKLNLDYEDLSGSTKRAKLQNLELTLLRRAAIMPLLDAVYTERPHLDLSHYLYLIMACVYTKDSLIQWHKEMGLPPKSSPATQPAVAYTQDIQEAMREQGRWRELVTAVQHKYKDLNVGIFLTEETAVDTPLVADSSNVVEARLDLASNNFKSVLPPGPGKPPLPGPPPTPPPLREKKVFVSYAWGGESENIVNQIDQAFQERGITFIRDKRDLGFKGLIREFMREIGAGQAIVAVISDKYLRSKNCMFELVEIASHSDFYGRIFPVVLPDAKIYDSLDRIEYIKYWDDKIKQLNEAMKSIEVQANLQGIREDIDLYTRVRGTIAGLMDILQNMNTLTADMHQKSQFEELYTAVERKLAE